MSREIEDYPVRFQAPVQWGEMDAFQHVNNVTYFRWFESARISALSEDRFTMEYAVFSESHGALAAEGEGEIVYFDYRGGAKAPVPEVVEAAIRELEGDRLA